MDVLATVRRLFVAIVILLCAGSASAIVAGVFYRQNNMISVLRPIGTPGASPVFVGFRDFRSTRACRLELRLTIRDGSDSMESVAPSNRRKTPNVLPGHTHNHFAEAASTLTLPVEIPE
jgi:hypothetical protein